MCYTLYYIHDPMCSWCYAYGPVLQRLLQALPPSVRVVRLLGGLAPDNDTPMNPEMRLRIEEGWRRIERTVPGTRFNFAFWERCIPYRSTYPGCRAVIAAASMSEGNGETMNRAIQHAYYREARNPSELSTLIEIATEIGLKREAFTQALSAAETEAELQRQIALAREIGADSYPSLFLEVDGSRWPLPIDYNDPSPTLETVAFLLDA